MPVRANPANAPARVDWWRCETPMAAAAHMRPGPKFFQNCGGKKGLDSDIAMKKIRMNKRGQAYFIIYKPALTLSNQRRKWRQVLSCHPASQQPYFLCTKEAKTTEEKVLKKEFFSLMPPGAEPSKIRIWRLRVRARITSPVWVLRHLSGKARGLRILLGMERTSNAARRDGSTPEPGKAFLREP